MAWIEEVGQRQRSTKIFRDSVDPLKKQLVASTADQHYHDGTAWQDIDETFRADTLSGFAHLADKVRHAIRVGSTGTRRWMPRRDHPNEYVEFGRLQSWSGTAWGNVNLGTATRTGQSVSWTTTNFNLKLTNTWRKIKIDVVLKTLAAKRRLRWAVSLVGVTYNAGDIVSVAEGVKVGHVDLPIAWDANGSIDNQNVTITTTYSGGYIEFGGDLSTAVLPITIDPTLTDGYGGDVTTYCDATLNSYSSSVNTNFGSATTVNLRRDTVCNSIFLFNVSSIDDAATINDATLSLYNNYAWTATGTFELNSILSANSAWTESGCTWNHSNASDGHWAGDAASNGGTDAGCSVSGTDYNATALGTFTFIANTVANTLHSISLTASQVGTWLTANYGLVIRTTSDTGNSTWSFFSSDNTATATRPKLVVNYTSGTNGSVTAVVAESPAAGVIPVVSATKSATVTSVPATCPTAMLIPEVEGESEVNGNVTALVAASPASGVIPVVTGTRNQTVTVTLATSPSASIVPVVTGTISQTVTSVLASSPASGIVPVVSGTISQLVTSAIATSPSAAIIPVVTGTINQAVTSIVADSPSASIVPVVTGSRFETVTALVATSPAEGIVPVVSGTQSPTVVSLVAESPASMPVPVVSGSSSVSETVTAIVATSPAEAIIPVVSGEQNQTITVVPAYAPANMSIPTITGSTGIVVAPQVGGVYRDLFSRRRNIKILHDDEFFVIFGVK
jgi:hypothetical protein